MKQLTCVLSDIRYLTFKRSSRFGATLPGDENKFHVLKIDKRDGFITYSLGRITPQNERYFNLTSAYNSIYEGNDSKLPEKVRIHVSCTENRPHYTSEHNSTNSNYKCHAGNRGATCGRNVPTTQQIKTKSFLQKLYYDTVSRNITKICGGEQKFNAEGRNNIEQNERILFRIKLLNPILHQNLINYTSQENSMYDPTGTNGIRVPNIQVFQPNTAINYAAQGPRRAQLPESERDIRIREERALERKKREEEEELKQQEELRLIKQEETRVLNIAAHQKFERRRRSSLPTLHRALSVPTSVQSTPIKEEIIPRASSAPPKISYELNSKKVRSPGKSSISRQLF